MKHPEMEIFSPWTWQNGMWEVLHLYSRYNKSIFVPATSTEEEFVSAYPTINEAGDSVSVVLVNRSVSATKSVKLELKGFDLDEQSFTTLKLSSLPSSETFTSHTVNALQQSTVSKTGNALNVSLSPLSITTIQLKGAKGEVVTGTEEPDRTERIFKVYPNPAAAASKVTVEINKTGYATLDLTDMNGRLMRSIYQGEITHPFKTEADLSGIAKGMYIFRLTVDGEAAYRKIFTF
jgi:hypothetical protein